VSSTGKDEWYQEKGSIDEAYRVDHQRRITLIGMQCRDECQAEKYSNVELNHHTTTPRQVKDQVNAMHRQYHPVFCKEFIARIKIELNMNGEWFIAQEAFPVKLYRTLCEAEKNGQTNTISFFPHGRSFIVRKKEYFKQENMPKHFLAVKWVSFITELSNCGFSRIKKGQDKEDTITRISSRGSCHCARR